MGVEEGPADEEEVVDQALAQAEIDAIWQKRTKRRGTLQDDLNQTNDLLAKLESAAKEKAGVAAGVEVKCRRGSVQDSPQRTAEEVAKLDAKVDGEEAAKMMQATWEKRAMRRGSLIDDIGATKEKLASLASSPNESKLTEAQVMLSQLQASDEAEQEAIQMLQELWQCQEVGSPTLAEDLEMSKAMLGTVEEAQRTKEVTAAKLAALVKES